MNALLTGINTGLSILYYYLMLRRTFCALQVDAGRRPGWITPGATRGVAGASPRQPRSGLNCYAVPGSVELSPCPGLHPGLSTLDAFRRRAAMQKYISCVTSLII
jgi:hypothetical protein